MSFRQLQKLFALSGLFALASCTTLDMNPVTKVGEQTASTQISDSAKREQAMADAVNQVKQNADAGVIRKIKLLGNERCLTETETELMITDFRTSMDTDLETRKKVADGSVSNSSVFVANQMKDLNDRFAKYLNPSSDQRILDQITKYGAQASSPRQSETCVNRMKKVAEFAKAQNRKELSQVVTSMAGKASPQDPAGIEVLVPEFEKRIKGLDLYRNLIGA